MDTRKHHRGLTRGKTHMIITMGIAKVGGQGVVAKPRVHDGLLGFISIVISNTGCVIKGIRVYRSHD